MSKDIILIDVLIQKLNDEFSWRRKELTLIKTNIPKIKNPTQSAMLRSALPLLYAHWEGFIKLSMSYYLEHVSMKYLKHSELKTPFITLSLQNKLGDLETNSFINRTKIIELLFTNFEKQSNIPKKNIINTKSNLRFDVLKEILYIVDLDDAYIDKQKELIDDLVDTRNHIAHGQYNPLDLNTFENFFDDIISLMDYLKTKIENNAIEEKYKKNIVTSIA